MGFYEAFAERVAAGDVDSRADLQRVKAELSRTHQLPNLPKNSEILAHLPEDLREAVAPLLRTKPVRTASGVAVVTVMTEPFPCPHGRCIYCPGGPTLGAPQSYTGHEPAAMRAARHAYAPREQAAARLDALRAMGHAVDKVELIIIGGTFTGFPTTYREGFVKGCYEAMNRRRAGTLDEAARDNESAPSRCVGLTIETKPESFTPAAAAHALGLGVTKVEFGVQSTFDDVLEGANRGHTVLDVVDATRRAKDAGLKVGYHMMPGLPGSHRQRDLKSLLRIVRDDAFRPDFLKVYPTLVIEGTALHESWRRGEYRPITTEEVVRLLARFKARVPTWMRIQRIQREIPVGVAAAGLDVGNVREFVAQRMAAAGTRCRCIRCREAGLSDAEPVEVTPHEERYRASGGEEVFLSHACDATDLLVAYARVRLCEAGAFLRELRVLGEALPLGGSNTEAWQHRGYGARLIERAERVAAEDGHTVLRVTSGVGVRPYYARLGYRRDGPYMVKAL